MNRTIVCRNCDNNKVIIEKVRQQLYIKCSKCGNTIMQAMHLECWNKNVSNTYKLRISVENGRLMEADIIERDLIKKEPQTLCKIETKIKFMYIKEYEYIRQLEEDECMEISYLNAQKYRRKKDKEYSTYQQY